MCHDYTMELGFCTGLGEEHDKVIGIMSHEGEFYLEIKNSVLNSKEDQVAHLTLEEARTLRVMLTKAIIHQKKFKKDKEDENNEEI